MGEDRHDPAAGIIGREPELQALRRFTGGEGPGRVMQITGAAGIGKTTLWEAGVAAAREQGVPVLAARPSSAEARLSFSALIDLLDGLDPAAMRGLPEPQRLALEVALLRREPGASPPEPRAIALGVLNTLKAVATEPVVVAIDDIQWLDPPSAEAVGFAARRLEGEPLAFLLAKRSGPPAPLEHALDARRVDHLEVHAMRLEEIRELLSERLDLTLPRLLLRRLVDATLGNPFFALEVGRGLVAGGVPRTGGDLPLPDTVEDALGARMRALPPRLRRALVALALGGDLDGQTLAAVAGSRAVEDGLATGLLHAASDRVRVAHPLLAAAAVKHATPEARRRVHLALAERAGDPEVRAQHVALATSRRDPALAETVAQAAGRAAARGARQQAVLLAEHALRLTPETSAAHPERLLTLAAYLEIAGEPRRLTELLGSRVAGLPDGAARARGWLLLAEGAHIATLEEFHQHLDRAAAAASHHPGLRIQALAKKAGDDAAGAVRRVAEVEVWARDMLPVAHAEGPEVERDLLLALGWASALRGRPIDDVCERFRTVSPSAYHISASPERIAGQRLVWRGEIAPARAQMAAALAASDVRGEPISYALMRLHLCELELRVGGWDRAATLLHEWEQSADRDLLLAPMFERCRALLAAGRGDSAEATRWIDAAMAAAETTGVGWDRCEALRARGIVALLDQRPEDAAQALRAVWAHTRREGVDEPGVFPVAPELVEALVEVDEHEEADEVTARLSDLAEAQGHPWGLATARRCRAVIRLRAGRNPDEAAALQHVADAYGAMSLGFDRARTLLTLGRAQRRLKQWGPAREALRAATAAFDELGSPGWAARGRAELDRVGARPARARGELTVTERSIADLAARGLSNREIAQALSLAVHTVEVHLSRVYGKLGIHSRRHIADSLAAVDAPLEPR